LILNLIFIQSVCAAQSNFCFAYFKVFFLFFFEKIKNLTGFMKNSARNGAIRLTAEGTARRCV